MELEEEILIGLSSLTGDKTPRLDGFQMEVYKRAWHFMRDEFIAIFREFHNTGYLDWRPNMTFITLMPKIEGEKEIYDYRLIC